MAIDWTKIYRKYKGLWVALLDDEKTIVGKGKSLDEALTQAQKKGYKNPVVMRVPTVVLPYVGNFRV